MRKFLYLILMLAVAGVVSCEKEPEVKPTPPEPTPPEDTYNWITEAELMGTWERWEDDANDENIKWKYVLGLYKPREKKGWMYFCRERYCNGEYINYTMKGSSEFKIIDGKLCDVSNKDKVYEYECSVEDGVLSITFMENGVTETYTRCPDISYKFVGDWSAQEPYGENQLLHKHYQFISVEDGFYYDIVTERNGAYVEDSRSIYFKYTFDDTTLNIKYISGGRANETFEYSLSGTDLYLNGEWYENFYEAHVSK